MVHLSVRRQDLLRARTVLRHGGVVVIPTDTAYGLAADPRQPAAIKRIFTIKRRPPEKALPWVAGSLAQVRKFFWLNPIEERIARRFWPGPLSIVLPLRQSSRTVAIRVPALAPLRRLCLLYGYPLTATSANRSGKPAGYAPAAVEQQFRSERAQPDALISFGRLPRRRPSTIIKLRRSKLVVLRPGPVSEMKIKAYV